MFVGTDRQLPWFASPVSTISNNPSPTGLSRSRCRPHATGSIQNDVFDFLNELSWVYFALEGDFN
jgi:hypothetical protein